MVNIIVGVIYRHKAFLMERNQIVDPVYLVQWEIRVNAMGIWSTRNEPPSADTAFKLVAVEGISPVHDKLKIIELVPFPVENDLSCFLRIHFVKPSLDFLFLRSFKVYLSAFFSIRCFGLIFTWSAFPSAKGKRDEAYINIAVFD